MALFCLTSNSAKGFEKTASMQNKVTTSITGRRENLRSTIESMVCYFIMLVDVKSGLEGLKVANESINSWGKPTYMHYIFSLSMSM